MISALLIMLSTIFISLQSGDMYSVNIPTIDNLNEGHRCFTNFAEFFHLDKQPVIPQSLTAVLPVLNHSLRHLEDLLDPFLEAFPYIQELIIVCPDPTLSAVRDALQIGFASFNSNDILPDVTLLPWLDFLDVPSVVFKAAADSTTDWALIMDDKGLLGSPLPLQKNLVFAQDREISIEHPDHSGNMSYYTFPQYGDQLRAQGSHSCFNPPFIAPVSLVASFIKVSGTVTGISWLDLCLYAKMGLSHWKYDIQEEELLSQFLSPSSNVNTLDKGPDGDWEDPFEDEFEHTDDPFYTPHHSGFHFLNVMPTQDDVRRMLPFLCTIQNRKGGITMNILIYNDQAYSSTSNLSGISWETRTFESNGCTVQYDILTNHASMLFGNNGSTLLSDWSYVFSQFVDVVLCPQEPDILVNYMTSHGGKLLFPRATVIQIPVMDLDQLQWMSALSNTAWRNWHRPQLDITVITKSRPQSLVRLMQSLQSARYFGDSVTLRVNVEQDCDFETLKVVENISWPFGAVFVHRRVVKGGLLPSVVESWYPQGNHTYGLFLEDDVEVSPLHYAWIKMNLLNYRYSDTSMKISNIFGISLYQQKHLELPPEGRRRFNPRILFSKAGLLHANTPYLSQIPCSWGAVYFPEHWREFHDYLSSRLTESIISFEDQVVPLVRSNFWSKSWKKFFIELVYLRGYAMLYPNYDKFLSLSTNHLEIGSHVKTRTLEKQDLFQVPLIQLQDSFTFESPLLDIPDKTLPILETLPVLNLTGSITSWEEIVLQGNLRRLDLFNCSNSIELYNIRSFMCIND